MIKYVTDAEMLLHLIWKHATISADLVQSDVDLWGSMWRAALEREGCG